MNSESKDEFINGVKIQRLPTIGKPLSLKRSKDMGGYADVTISDPKKLKAIKEIAKELAKKKRR